MHGKQKESVVNILIKLMAISHFWVICTSGFIFQESGDGFLFSKTPLEIIETLQTVCKL